MFITIEGLDGAGKGTLIEGLKEKLIEEGYETVFLTNLDGRVEISDLIRRKDLNGGLISTLHAGMIYSVALIEVNELVNKYLEEGYVVFCDRWISSTYAYTYGAMDAVLDEVYDNILKPDLEILLMDGGVDTIEDNVDLYLERINKRNEKKGTYEDQDKLIKIKKVYLQRYRHKRDVNSYTTILDCDLPEEALLEEALKVIEESPL